MPDQTPWLLLTQPAWLALIGGVVILLITAVTLGRRRARRLTRSIAHAAGLAVDADLDAEFRRVLERRVAWWNIGRGLGAATIWLGLAAWWFIWPAASPGASGSTYGFSGVILFAAAYVGYAAGGAIAATCTALPRDPDSQRIARAAAPTVDDYLHPRVHAVARASVIVAAAVFVCGVAASVIDLFGRTIPLGDAVFGAPGGVLILAAVVSYALAEWVCRVIVGRPQRAATPLQLAWDDALRSRTMLECMTVPPLLAIYGCVLTAFGLVSNGAIGDGNPALIGAEIFNGALLIVALVLFALVLSAEPAKYFIRRLWGGTPPAPLHEAATA